MGSATKLKACYNCTAGKRKCDKAQPMCSRCDERDVDCRYPPLRRRRTQIAHDSHAQRECVPSADGQPCQTDHLRLDNIVLSPSAGQLVDLDQWTRHLINWDQDTDTSSQQLHTAVTEYQLPPTDTDDTGPSTTTNISYALTPSTNTTFFLKPASWVVHHLRVETPVFSPAVSTNYVRGVHAWFTQWVTQGHSPFIHRQLYADTGLPQCMRDAFSSITVYDTKTPANEALVNDILETNASSLLNTYMPESSTRLLDTRHHLARTQALFIHVVLSLFSPSLHARSTAERYITTLLRWTQQLWDAASIDPNLQDLGSATDDITAASAASADALFDGDPHPRLWRAWVLSESVRRIWLLATTTIGVYFALTQRWAQCQGGVSFTARRSLWTAQSAVAWADACNAGDPLFICSLQDDVLFRHERAVEVDELARNFFTIVWGAERVESWIARTAGREGKVALWF